MQAPAPFDPPIPGAAHLELDGDLDLARAGAITAKALQLLDAFDLPHLVVDVHRVSFLDAAGIGALVRIRNATLARGRQFRIVEVPRPIRRVLQVVELNETFLDATDR